ncbi:4-oxalocrotonate tautomerase family protein [Deinococcus oregonensis]|uniref:4-oxalocrotonate tautomerase family protein n=1 Tax=Deinococcus oregonensis TaxID=1805970 RepID=A0ABV6ATG7_9DEIO
MPIITVEVTEGVLDASRKRRMIELLTEASIEAEGIGEAGRATTIVGIREVPVGNSSFGGHIITQARLDAIRQLQSQQKTGQK